MMRSQRLRSKSASESNPRRVSIPVSGFRRAHSSGLTSQDDDYYAGAKFDSVPELVEVPVPPMHWRIEEPTRSQSTPSSPITVYDKASPPLSVYGKSSLLPPRRIKLDIESLFGTKKSSTATEFCDSHLGRLLHSAISL